MAGRKRTFRCELSSQSRSSGVAERDHVSPGPPSICIMKDPSIEGSFCFAILRLLKNYKNLLKVGCITIGISVFTLIYDFSNMYSLVGKCPGNVDPHPCQAYVNWVALNDIGLIILAIGVTILVIGLWRRHLSRR